MSNLKVLASISFDRMSSVLCQIAILMLICGCGHQQEQLIQETSAHHNSSDIRKAVLPLFSKYPYDSMAQIVVPFDEIPKEVKSLPVFSMNPNVIITCWASTNNNALAFLNGSGFGHWGIVVCRDEEDRQLSGWKGYKYWGHGIYFYNGQ